MKSFNVFRRNNTTGDLKKVGSVMGKTRLDALKRYARRGYGFSKGNYLVLEHSVYAKNGVRISKSSYKTGTLMRSPKTNKLIKLS
jgi:hypothetical protein